MRKPCCDKQQGPNKGAWSKQEDQKLIDYIRTHGEGCWRSLAKAAGELLYHIYVFILLDSNHSLHCQHTLNNRCLDSQLNFSQQQC